ncbi:hypothetical protein [Legionella sp. CNM-4043-24]|uniref:hypothetical protein n=1 Tax=Legionella sp. CNM-4043-24 TaxID=3421646 RepID=UPI00403ACF1D
MKPITRLTETEGDYSRNSAFISEANTGVEQLNRLIAQFNRAKTKEQKLEILLELQQHTTHIINKFPPALIAQSPEFQRIFQIEMVKSVQEELKKIGVESIYQPRLDEEEYSRLATSSKSWKTSFDRLRKGKGVFGELSGLEGIRAAIESTSQQTSEQGLHRELIRLKRSVRTWIAEQSTLTDKQAQAMRDLVSATNARLLSMEQKNPSLGTQPLVQNNPFAEFIANMPPEKVAGLTEILARGSKYNREEELAKLYAPGEPGAKTFAGLLSTHKIKFLGGKNARNLTVESTDGQHTFVIKVDRRGNTPKSLEEKVTDSAAGIYLPNLAVDRSITIINKKREPATHNLQVSEYFAGGDLVSHSKQHKTDEARLKSAVNIYRQQAQMLVDMGRENVAVSDLKNANGLIDKHGKLRLADTKSLLPVTDGMIIKHNNDSQWFDFVSTQYMDPPEVRKDILRDDFSFNADQYHAWMLGKNLYQYLTGCDSAYLNRQTNGQDFDFSKPLFESEEGRQCRTLIQSLVRLNPSERMPVADALQQLSMLDNGLNPRAEASSEQMAAASSSAPSTPSEKKKGVLSRLNPFKGSAPRQTPIAGSSTQQTYAASSNDPGMPPAARGKGKARPDPLQEVKADCQQLEKELSALKKRQGENQSGYEERLTSANSAADWTGLKKDLSKDIERVTDELMKAVRRECGTIAREINAVRAKRNEENLDFKGHIASPANLASLDDLKRRLQATFDTENELLRAHLKSECSELRDAIAQHAVGMNDRHMQEYLTGIDRSLRYTERLADLENLKTNLSATLYAVSSADVHEIQNTVANYRTGKTEFFAVNKNVKAASIEGALAAVPLHLRGSIFDEGQTNQQVREVKKELARHRYFGKRGKVYTQNGEVDASKAASTFRSVKDRVQRIKEQERQDNPGRTLEDKPKFTP